MKIGVFGGTFNPPHQGHLRMANAFYEAVKPDKMLIIPNKRPVHKICEDLALDEERLELCKRNFKDKIFEVSDIEIESEKPSFTAYTLEKIKKQYPNAEIAMLIGSDMFLSFHKWYHYQDILNEVTLYVASRQDEDSLKVLRNYAFKSLKIYLQGAEKETIKFLPIAPLEVSSSEIREKISQGQTVENLVTTEVLEYIKERNMYGYR